MARVARAADLDEVCACLASAFHEDPVWGHWTFPDERRRHELLVQLMRRWVQGALPHGWVWMTEGAEAVAVWLPPGAAELTAEQEREFEEFIAIALGPRASELDELFTRFEQHHPVEEPHYYLSLWGTHREHAGHGLGTQLLGECLARIDREGMPAYLESTNPVNVQRYEALGFVRSGSFESPAGGPEVATMWRAGR